MVWVGDSGKCVPENLFALPYEVKGKKKNNVQLPVEVWAFIFTHLRLSDLVETSCVCKELYYICGKDQFYDKKITRIKNNI